MSTPTRTPAGIPTGGQFAATTHAEADVALGTAPSDASAMWARVAAAMPADQGSHPADYSDGYLRALAGEGPGTHMKNAARDISYQKGRADAANAPQSHRDFIAAQSGTTATPTAPTPAPTAPAADDSLDDDETCSHCGTSTADGEGYDGMCGGCADLVAVHDEGTHRGNPEADCPSCQ